MCKNNINLSTSDSFFCSLSIHFQSFRLNYVMHFRCWNRCIDVSLWVNETIESVPCFERVASSSINHYKEAKKSTCIKFLRYSHTMFTCIECVFWILFVDTMHLSRILSREYAAIAFPRFYIRFCVTFHYKFFFVTKCNMSIMLLWPRAIISKCSQFWSLLVCLFTWIHKKMHIHTLICPPVVYVSIVYMVNSIKTEFNENRNKILFPWNWNSESWFKHLDFKFQLIHFWYILFTEYLLLFWRIQHFNGDGSHFLLLTKN